MKVQESPQPVGRYLLAFAGLYTVLAFALLVVLDVLKIRGNTGAGVGITMASTIFVTKWFFTATGRFFNKSELEKLVLGSLVIVLVVSSILMLITPWMNMGTSAVAMNIILDMQSPVWLFARLFDVLMQGAVLWLGYGWLAPKILAKSQS